LAQEALIGPIGIHFNGKPTHYAAEKARNGVRPSQADSRPGRKGKRPARQHTTTSRKLFASKEDTAK